MEAERASELAPGGLYAPTPEAIPGAYPGGPIQTEEAPDVLGVSVNDVRRQIHSFDDARLSDLANERLPQYDVSTSPTAAVPSMRFPRIPGVDDGPVSGDLDGGGNIEALIRRALQEEGLEDGGVVERLAERIAIGSRAAARPRGVKRFETA